VEAPLSNVLGAGEFVGCRAFPTLECVREAIAITREAFNQFVNRVSSAEWSLECRNKAILHVVWHQCYAVGIRGINLPYIPLSAVNRRSGLTTLRDKDSGTGYKARLVWLPPSLLRDMTALQKSVRLTVEQEFGRAIDPSPGYPKFFFEDERVCLKGSFSRAAIERVSHDFFAFPTNTPRRVMRYLLKQHGLSPERVDVFMGHWRERREPWGRWSSFDYSEYFRQLRQLVPKILHDLGFEQNRND
jgi:hypothetical protein